VEPAKEQRPVVARTTPGRKDRRQIVYAKLMDTGVAGVAAAKLAYDRAQAMGVGKELEW
jgi:ornithine cyclodeaminase/alanine dehydrogenase-like protein (mu-crystallin family)